MQRIASSTRKLNLWGTCKDGFTAGTPGVEAATVLSADWGNYVQEEISRAIEIFGGTALDGTKYDQLSTVLTNARNATALAREHANARGALCQALASVYWHDSSLAYIAGIAANPLTLTPGGDYAWFAACSGGKIRASYDGLNWDTGSAASSYTGNFAGLTYAHGTMLLYGASGEIQTIVSAGGSLTATRRKTGGSNITALENNNANTALLAVDSGGHVWKSTSGLTWSDIGALLSSPTDVRAGKTTANADCFVAIDGANAKISTDDGSTWVSHTVASGATIKRVVWCSDLSLWFATGADTTSVSGIWSSADAVTWSRVYTGDASVSGTCTTRVPGGVLAAFSSGRAIFYDGTTTRTAQCGNTLSPSSRQPLAYTYCPDKGEAVLWVATQNPFDSQSYLFRGQSWSPIYP